MKMYFKGGKGILNPTDFNGDEIKSGNILTGDYFDPFFDEKYYKTHFPKWSKEEIEEHKHKPLYIVKYNDKGFFYGEGIDKELYMHDFRFKFTKKIEI